MTDTTCPNCGCTPMGEGCYHICVNSTHYYSPEQEREDERNWSRADYMRETYGDPDLDREYDTDEGEALTYEYALEHGHDGGDADDIPF